jgi:cell division transport system ATP-binding protein
MIRLENVTKVYEGGVVAAKDVGLEINKGEFMFLVGPSGSGKSTLIRLMLAEERPTSGDIWVAGKHASRLPSWKIPHLRRSIGTVFQDYKLLPNKTVYENVAFALEVTGRPRHVVRSQVPQVLKLVGLSAKANRYPRQLSGGEQQRVSIGRAFVNRPLILLADEPTGNLDPATSVGIMRILDRINRTGTTVVMATHDHAIVDAMRRRVVQLDRGRVVRDQSRGVYEGGRRRPRPEAVAEPEPVPESGAEEEAEADTAPGPGTDPIIIPGGPIGESAPESVRETVPDSPTAEEAPAEPESTDAVVEDEAAAGQEAAGAPDEDRGV